MMTFSAIFDLVLGMIVFYYVLSLIVSTITSKIAEWTDLRAQLIEQRLHKLLTHAAAGQPANQLEESFAALKASPLVQHVVPPGTQNRMVTSMANWFNRRMEMPGISEGIKFSGKVPSATFAAALLDAFFPPDGENEIMTRAMNSVQTLPAGNTKQTLMNVLETADNDLNKARTNLENWFDGAMSSVSQVYRKYTRRITFYLSVILVLAVNADSIAVAERLYQDPTLRAQTSAQAEQLVQAGASSQETTSQLIDTLDQTGLPIFWGDVGIYYRNADNPTLFVIEKIAGLFITWLALSLGASFWYDLLKGLRGNADPTATARG